MNIVIHRGTHEIGGSCIELIGQESRIIIDIGKPLIDNKGDKFDFRDYKDLSGPELVQEGVLPEVEDIYSWEENNKSIASIAGLLLSHPHQDHYGFVNYLAEDIPIYLGEATKKLIEITVNFTSVQGDIKNPQYIKSGQAFPCGEFTITPYLMDHSAYDAYAFLIQSEGKTILYSGDFREHGRKSKAFYWFLYNTPEEIDALLLEGTSFGRNADDFINEEMIKNKMIKIARQTVEIVFIHQSSQNIDRLVSFYKASFRANRLFVIDIYTAEILNSLKEYADIPHPANDYENIRVYYPYRLKKRMKAEEQEDILNKFKGYEITIEEIVQKSQNIMMLIRPSMLSDLRYIDTYFNYKFETSSYVYSLWEGYLEEEYMQKMMDFIENKNIQFYQLHTSGHASPKTLQKVVNNLNPEKIIPIHTFYPEKYKNIFDNALVKIYSDGEVINI